MDVSVLVSGGKDSTLALYRALKKGHVVKNLVAMFPQRADSFMFHFPNVHLTPLFAKAVEISLIKAETAGIEEAELIDLKRVLSTLNVEGVVHGAVASNYQKKRIEKICRELELKPIAPLWREDPIELLREMINLNFQIIIVGVYAHGFDESWLGRKIDEKTLKDLIRLNEKYRISVVGEGGEYETLVLDAPIFKKKIQIIKTRKIWKDDSGYLLVEKAELTNKKCCLCTHN
jgi:ABC transporter with metal-binding/Fe-S-binding domain ATP-binding protein